MAASYGVPPRVAGAVVGFGVGTAGDVEGVGKGVTVLTDGPALVVSLTRSVVGPRNTVPMIMAANTTASIASISGSSTPASEGR
jgi:hypothetical protein